MIHHVDAVFSKGMFRPLDAISIAEGTRVRLSVEDGTPLADVGNAAKIRTPRLVNPKDAAHFVMDVSETDNAGL